MNHTVRSVQRLVQLSPDVAKADQLLLAELGILDFVDALCAQLLKLRPEVSKMAPLLRGALDTFLAQRMPHSSSGGSLCRLLTPDKPLSRQISAEGSPKTEDRRLSWEGETRFWRRLGGQGEYQGGSRLRLLRMDALTRNWCCFFVDLKAGPSKARQYRSKQRQEPRAHEQPAHDDKCPLCKGREEATEVLRVWPDGRLEEREGLPEQEEDKTKWLVRVLRNPFPYLLTPQELYEKSFPGDRSKHAACFGDHDNHAANPDADHPLYRMVDGFGASEVVVESPTHNALIGIAEDNQVINTLRAMAARGRSLRKCQRVLQLMYFKQYGMEASGSLIHP
ncbi:unnamed protein product, partial [Effrenium voratum]